MNRSLIIAVAFVLPVSAFAQQPAAPAPSCPDYTQTMSLCVMYAAQRDNWQTQAYNLNNEVIKLRKQVEEQTAKIKIDDDLIKSLRGDSSIKKEGDKKDNETTKPSESK